MKGVPSKRMRRHFLEASGLNNSRALINYGDVSIQSFIEQGTGNTSAKNLISNVSGDHLV